MTRPSRLLVRYILTYVLVLSIPILMLSAFIGTSLLGLLESNVIEANHAELARAAQLFDEILLAGTRIAVATQQNPEISNYFMLTDSMQVYRVVQELGNYRVANGVFDDIIYYIHGTDFVTASTGTYSLTSLFRVYRFEQWDLDSFLTLTSTIRAPMLRASEAGLSGRYLTYLYPINNNTVVFLINEDAVAKLYGSPQTEYALTTLLLNDEFEPLYASSAQAISSDLLAEIPARIRSSARNHFTLDVDGHDQIVSFARGDGVYHVSLTPRDVIQSRIAPVKASIIVVVTVTFLLGSAVVLALAVRNYNSIRSIWKRLDSRYRSDTASDELESISRAIAEIDTENQRYHELVESVRPILRRHLMLNVLNGRGGAIDDPMEFQESVLALGQAESFWVAVLETTMSSPDAGGTVGDIMARSVSVQQDCEIEAHIVETIDPQKFVYILAGVAHDVHVTRLLEDVVRECELAVPGGVNVGVSSVTHELLDLGRLYLESVDALQHAFVLGHHRIVHASLVQPRTDRQAGDLVVRVPQMMRAVEQAVQQADANGIQDAILLLVAFIEEQRLPVQFARTLSFDIANTVFRAMVGSDVEIGSIRTSQLERWMTGEIASLEEMKEGSFEF